MEKLDVILYALNLQIRGLSISTVLRRAGSNTVLWISLPYHTVLDLDLAWNYPAQCLGSGACLVINAPFSVLRTVPTSPVQ